MTGHEPKSTVCEIRKPGGGWKAITVDVALEQRETEKRCVECHGAVRAHKTGGHGVPAAHFEHRMKHEGCSLGHAFDGKRRPHPSALT
jgi:hypothetical protein